MIVLCAVSDETSERGGVGYRSREAVCLKHQPEASARLCVESGLSADVGWAVPTIPQPIVVGTAHPTKSHTVEVENVSGGGVRRR